MNAPNSGTYAGVAIYRDVKGGNQNSSFSGGNVDTIVGAVYVPTGQLTFSGGSGVNDGQCHAFIAYQITFSGGSGIASIANCSAVGTSIGGSPYIALAE